MKKLYFIGLLVFVFLITRGVINIQAQTYTTLPYLEHFDKAWVNGTATRDLPNAHWKNTPAATDSSWSRDDDGYSRGAWSWSGGSYSPADARQAGHSARFHSYNAAAKTSGKLDLYVNFSAPAGNKTLMYSYINTDGNDSLEVFLSINGGGTFAKVNSQKTNSTWTQITVNLGNISATNGIVRFKATSDFGVSDIGLDEVAVFGAGNPPVVANFNSNLTTGMPPFAVNFSDQSTGSPTSWKWDFNNDGTIDATSQNPVNSFTIPGVYTVKLIAINAISSDTITRKAYIQANSKVSIPFTEHFDNTWVNFKGTRDVPSLNWGNTPATGANSWSRDNDGNSRGAWGSTSGSYSPTGAKGTGHSARFHSNSSSSNGILDLNVDFSAPTGNKTLTYFYINKDGVDVLDVLLSINGGGTFTKINSQAIQSAWTKIVLNIGNVTSANGVIRFRATGDGGDSDIGIDEVSITGSSTVVANFSADVTNIPVSPITVNFKDLSTGTPTSWKWDFNNDGVIDAITQNPSYNYTTQGAYSVKLIASNQTSSDTTVFNNFIKLTGKASLPFTEHFDNNWVNFNDVRDVPSLFLSNTPATGANSWSRDDDGITRGAWGSSSGSYSPTGANSTSHSARIHTYDTYNQGSLDLNVDFSTAIGNKTLTYYYINVDGTDSLEVFLSGDMGKTFTKVSSKKIQAAWGLITVNLGNIAYPNGIVRFKATGDYGSSDIGIDEVSITGTGVSTTVKADFTSNITSGVAPLTVRFYDRSGNSPSTYSWDFNNDGTVESADQNPTYTFTTPGFYNVKLKVTNASSKDSIVKNVFIKVTGKATVPFTENFDNSWINLNDTLDVPSLYWNNSPATGNNSWSRDDQGLIRHAWSNLTGSYSPSGANSTSHSARFHSYSAASGKLGILDLNIDFTTAPIKDTLSFFYNNTNGSDSLEVFLSTDKGANFTKVNSQKVVTNWTKIKVSLGDIHSADGVIRFKATADYGNSDIGLDGVSVTGKLNKTDILTYSLPGQTGVATINTVSHTISVNMPYGTSVTSLAATFTLSAGATAKIGTITQVSGTTANNFTGIATYTVTAEDATTTQDWTVAVTVAKNSQTVFTTFSLPGQTGIATINTVNQSISVNIPYGTSVTSLVATFDLSVGATAKVGAIAQISATTANDFTAIVTYLVTAEDAITAQAWTVTVTVAKNDQTDFISYALPSQVGSPIIDAVNHTITVKVPSDLNRTAIVATFVLSNGASVNIGSTLQVSTTTPNDFTNAVTYSVIAEDNTTTQAWTVTVSNATGVFQITSDAAVVVFPNPSNGIFKVSLTSAFSGKISTEVYDFKGIKLLSKEAYVEIGEHIIPIDLTANPSGIYNLLIRTKDKIFRLKLNKI